MKILIAVPCMDQVPAPFCQSLAQLQKVGDCVLTMKAGSLIYLSRNELATAAIQIEADYVFWLDSDMVFKPDTLTRMMETLKANDLDILTGLYFRRVPPCPRGRVRAGYLPPCIGPGCPLLRNHVPAGKLPRPAGRCRP